jgi:hypothetical protein
MKSITTTTGAILSATLVAAAAAFLLFSLSPQAQAQTEEDDITTTITEGLASGFESGADQADEGGNSDLGDEFRAVVDSLRSEDGICQTCGT